MSKQDKERLVECRRCGRMIDIHACGDCSCHRPAADPIHDPRRLGYHYLEATLDQPHPRR